MPRLAAFSTVVALVVLLNGGVWAVEQPDVDELKAHFAMQVPGYWGLSSFDIEASANYGTEVEPVIKHRFTAEVNLRADTFVLESKEGATTWITAVAKSGEKRTIYGIATSTYRAGGWKTELALENNPLVRVGQPRDFFSGLVIARGTEEEVKYREQVDQQREAELGLKHQEDLDLRKREEELRLQEREEELARLAHEERVRETERKRQDHDAATAQAEEEALVDDLAQRTRSLLAIQLPGYWEVAGFEVHDAVKSGTAAVPVYEQGFSADIELTDDTYIATERGEGVVFVMPVAKAGEKRKLYGTATGSARRNYAFKSGRRN